MQLFCFTYAGGTAAFYDELEKACGSNIILHKYEYPGHGTRYKESLCTEFREVVEDFFKYMRLHYDGGQYALMGYSMGCIAVIEVLRSLMNRESEYVLPSYVFLAAHQPGKVVSFSGLKKCEIQDYIKRRTIEFGGIPEPLINSNVFWRTYLPLYYADYLMIDKYSFEENGFHTNVPAVIFYSEMDTPESEMKKWKNYFLDKCDFIEYSGNHFFIKSFYSEMAKEITERIGGMDVF